MSELIKFNLPKVKLRVKTLPLEHEQTDNSQSLFREYSAGPSILQERLKMKKQIQDSYLKFRRKKKSNYLKPLSNSKRMNCHHEEKHNSLLIKTKTNPLLNHTEFTLEVDPQNQDNSHSRKKNHERFNMITCISNKKRQSSNRELLTGKKKETSQSLLQKNSSLQGTEHCSTDFSMQLQGTSCKYTHSYVSKKLLSFLKDNSVRKNLKKETTKYNRSNSFQIDPWRADNMSKLSQENEKDFRQEY